MSGIDRRKYLTATVLDQDLLDWCADNLETRIEMACDIEAPGGDTIRVSDRNKYVGQYFYEARVRFPEIIRTVGEWLSPNVSFSTLTIEVSNVDGRYNKYLAGGSDYGGWIGRAVTVKIGLGEQDSTYVKVFSGIVTDVGGFQISTRSFTIVARDQYDFLNDKMLIETFKESEFPKIQEELLGTLKPVIYGDYTVSTTPFPAIVPAYVVNGANPQLDLEDRDFTISSVSNPGIFFSRRHLMDVGDELTFETTDTLPTPLSTATSYWITSVTNDDFTVTDIFGGSAIQIFDTGIGNHSFRAVTRVPVKCYLTYIDIQSLDAVYLERENSYFLIPFSEITVNSGNKSFDILQGGTWFSVTGYEYKQTDRFYVKCKGIDLGLNSDNAVSQAKDILSRFTGFTETDANWTIFETKVSSIKSRVWHNQDTPTIDYVLSLLEQVRLEAFISGEAKLKINSLHFDDFVAIPSFTVFNHDIVKGSFEPLIDEQNNFNRAQASYDFHPISDEQASLTKILKNQNSINQINKKISKKVEFPNLYLQNNVQEQLTEILKIASATLYIVNLETTWRSFLLDVGDFVFFNVSIGSAVFEDVPCLIRTIGYDPVGLKIILEVWSFAMCPFPGYEPGYAGTVGGYNATITEE